MNKYFKQKMWGFWSEPINYTCKNYQSKMLNASCQKKATDSSTAKSVVKLFPF